MSDVLQGSHHCVAHQSNTSHYAPENCEQCRLEKENASLRNQLWAYQAGTHNHPVGKRWYTVPDYQPGGTPATTATVVDAAGQHIATFDRITDAERAVAAYNLDNNHD